MRELEKYENNPIILRYSTHLFKDALPVIWEDYQNGLLKDKDLVEINGVSPFENNLNNLSEISIFL